MPHPLSRPRRMDARGRGRAGGSLCAWLIDDSDDIEESILGGFYDWYAWVGEDDRQDSTADESRRIPEEA